MTPEVEIYQRLNLPLLYWLREGDDPKEWKGPHEKGWNAPDRVYDLRHFDPSIHNLGVFTGREISTGKHLVDVDLDKLNDYFVEQLLPKTSFATTRPGKPVSHLLYTTPTPMEGKHEYTSVRDNSPYIEIRGTRHQTMLPPSLHTPPDRRVQLLVWKAFGHADLSTLQAATLDYAIASLVVEVFAAGLHHDDRLALAGFLLKRHFTGDRVQKLLATICQYQVKTGVPDMSGYDVDDSADVVTSTVKRLENHQRVEGSSELKKVNADFLKRLASWLGRDGGSDFLCNDNGVILKDSQENIRRALVRLDYALSFDTFAEKLMVNGAPLEDQEFVNIWARIDEECHFKPEWEFYKRIIKHIAWSHPYHPVRDYLDSLVWDGVPRIDQWLVTYGGAVDSGRGDGKKSYFEAVSGIMLIAAVRRIRHPGCKYDEMVVWESPQGFNKSQALLALCPRAEWFMDDFPLNLKAKELVEMTLGKWLIEASELSGKRKTEIERLKALLSRQVDGPVRKAYGYLPTERPRHFILIGTTNATAYLNDPTGGRRFWPVKVKRFDLTRITADRDQLWAEAAYREARGESIRLEERLWADATREQERRREVDPWEAKLRTYLLGLTPYSEDQKLRIPTSDLWTVLGVTVDHRDRQGAIRISDIMQHLGFTRATVRPPKGEPEKGYIGAVTGLVLHEDEPVEEATPTPNPPEDDEVPF